MAISLTSYLTCDGCRRQFTQVAVALTATAHGKHSRARSWACWAINGRSSDGVIGALGASR
jgi:hypothetical protein